MAALGGNAFAAPGHRLTMAGQFAYAEQALTHLLPLLAPDVELLLVHGNGPQVGELLQRMEMTRDLQPPLPLDMLVAQTEGSLGYLLQRALLNELRPRHIDRFVVTMITQVLVDPEDPAFDRPSKPVGPFFSQQEAERCRDHFGWVIGEDIGRARAIGLRLLEGDDRYLPEPAPKVVVTALNDYNVAMELRVWLEDERDHIEARLELRERLFEALRDDGVEMPFETFSVVRDSA